MVEKQDIAMANTQALGDLVEDGRRLVKNSSNWNKAIQNAMTTLLAISIGVGLSIAFSSLLPATVAIAGCWAWTLYAARANWLAKQRIEALERQIAQLGLQSEVMKPTLD